MTMMTMSAAGASRPRATVGAKPLRRVGVAEAKAHFADLLREADTTATVIHNRGRDVAVVLSMSDYARLTSGVANLAPAGQQLIRALLKWHDDVGGVDFEPEQIRVKPAEFALPRARPAARSRG